MARAIVRFSMSGDDGTTTTTARECMQKFGFRRVGTGSWEASGAQIHDLMDAVRSVTEILEHPKKAGVLDHLWVYIDDEGRN